MFFARKKISIAFLWMIMAFFKVHGVYCFFHSIHAKLPSQVKSHCTWSPQDLTQNSEIPENDYIKQYQRNPKLWPVEFFIIAYRRHEGETQILVRRSANGTSKYGVGTGVPVTRWMLSTAQPPKGYEFRNPPLTVDARSFPEFPKDEVDSWTYAKIDIRQDAFSKEFMDSELEQYAIEIRKELQMRFSDLLGKESKDAWESSCISTVQKALENPNSVAAIQGTLRMSGLFEQQGDQKRYIELGENAPDPEKLVMKTRIYTMFPQMPSPLPLPSASPEELKEEIASRPLRIKESGRDPHKDRFGRKYTHISTSNVSNTIHGVYFCLDVTDFGSDLDEVPALDLFGIREIEREWVSLEDLKVVGSDGKTIGTEDTKPTFISGFIVRQLVREGVFDVL